MLEKSQHNFLHTRMGESCRGCWQGHEAWELGWSGQGESMWASGELPWGKKNSFWYRNQGWNTWLNNCVDSNWKQNERGQNFLLHCTIRVGMVWSQKFLEGSHDAEWLKQIAVEMWDQWRQNNAHTGLKNYQIWTWYYNLTLRKGIFG